jgi:hypothetical protein
MFCAVVITVWIIAEIWHHLWSIRQVGEIDDLYRATQLDRDVDVVDHPSVGEFEKYWERASEAFKKEMAVWSESLGVQIDSLIQSAKNGHIGADFVASINPRSCLPMTMFFRTYNTMKIFLTRSWLKAEGFQLINLPNVQLSYFGEGDRPLLLIYPQFSGEFQLLSVFSELKQFYDIMFVSPLGTQFSWWQIPSRHSDCLQDYLPFVLKHREIHAVTWSAGNIHFQVLDRYCELRSIRSRIKSVVRLDPLGYPASNFLIYSSVPLSWYKVWRRFYEIGKCNTLTSKAACLGFSYLLKCCHGYTYLKLGRMLRCTKLAPAPYQEHLFTAKCDPTFSPDHHIYVNDRKILCQGNVTEYIFEGFHGLWLTRAVIRQNVFPVLIKHVYNS